MTEINAVTPEGLEALKREIEHLETVARREIADRIRTAREWGDLKENAEYHDAKNDQAMLETRILRLNVRLRQADVVEAAPDNGAVSFGSTVTVLDETSGREATYTLVGSTESDLGRGLLSAESPVARALMGRREGEIAIVVTPRAERRLTVLKIGA